jgi:hypothetical protein
LTRKRQGILEPYVPAELAKWPASERDPDGLYASVRFTLMPIADNTNLVKPEDAPKSFADLLDPKWSGKIVKAHPSYSGGIVTSTFQTVNAIGWGYFEKLAKQKVLQVESSTEPPKKLALGERAVAADGLEYVHILGSRTAVRRSRSSIRRRERPSFQAVRRLPRTRRIPTRRGCSSASCSRAKSSNILSMPPGCARFIRR